MHATNNAGIKILQAPACHYGIKSEDDHGSDDAHQSQGTPRLMLTQIGISTGCIGCRMTTDDKLAQHTWQTQQNDAD